MKKQILIGLASASLLAIVACGGDDNVTNPTDAGKDSNVADTGGGDSGNNDAGNDAGKNPAPPTLGTQVDRLGRPAINTALNHAFDPSMAAGTAKDAYNADKDPTKWAANYTAEFAKNLAIYDSLDTVCGNQLLAGGGTSAGTYNTLAAVLTGDELFTDTSQSTCSTYLAVEVATLSMMPGTDCGGRTLKYDVIDATYTVASGASGPVGDGISADTTKTGGTTFPYLAAPK